MTENEALNILARIRVIAVVGCSANPEKPSHYVPAYLKEHGYQIVPVNPTAKTDILGEKVYARLSDIPGKIDAVEIFRPSEDVPPIVEEAITKGAKVVWMQTGIVNEAAAGRARKAGLTVVMDQCMMALLKGQEVKKQRDKEVKNKNQGLFSLLLYFFASLLLTSFLAGCGEKKGELVIASAPESKEVNIEESATITGHILFEGTVSERKELPIGGNPECSVLAHGKILSETLLVKEGKLANVFIYVKDGLENSEFPAPSEPVVIDNTNCVYVPHVSGAQEGQPVQFVNRDPTLHNIHAFPKNQAGFNLGLPFQGMKQTKKFSKPEVMIPLKCDVHPWMMGYLGVLEHPYFAVSGPDGSFEIKNLPPGRYVLEAWHESLGIKTLEVDVQAKESKEISLKFNDTGSPLEPAPDSDPGRG